MKVASPKGHNSRARGLQQVDACFDLAGSLGLAVVMTVVVADGVYKGWHLVETEVRRTMNNEWGGVTRPGIILETSYLQIVAVGLCKPPILSGYGMLNVEHMLRVQSLVPDPRNHDV